MKKLLISGATGNIGKEVIHHFFEPDTKFEIIAAVRNIEDAKRDFSDKPNLNFRLFDIKNRETFNSAFKEIETLFLLRPPQISQAEEYFLPLLKSAQKNEIRNIPCLCQSGYAE